MDSLFFDLNATPHFLYAGRYVAQENATHPTRTLDNTVILLGIQGQCSIAQEGRTYLLQPDHYLILPAGVRHVGTEPVTPGQSHFWCHFHMPEGTTELPIYGRLQNPDRLHILFHQMIDTVHTSPDAGDICGSYVRILLWELARNEHIHLPHRPSARAIEYVRSHADLPLSPSQVADALGYSGDYLTDLLKQDTGHTLTQTIHKTKMQRACNLLFNSDLPVYAIADSCGISDVKYFTRLFHRTYGVSPSEYRKNLVLSHINHR
jgi:AraC-like DNA-binding protein